MCKDNFFCFALSDANALICHFDRQKSAHALVHKNKFHNHAYHVLPLYLYIFQTIKGKPSDSVEIMLDICFSLRHFISNQRDKTRREKKKSSYLQSPGLLGVVVEDLTQTSSGFEEVVDIDTVRALRVP